MHCKQLLEPVFRGPDQLSHLPLPKPDLKRGHGTDATLCRYTLHRTEFAGSECVHYSWIAATIPPPNLQLVDVDLQEDCLWILLTAEATIVSVCKQLLCQLRSGAVRMLSEGYLYLSNSGPIMRQGPHLQHLSPTFQSLSRVQVTLERRVKAKGSNSDALEP